MPLVEKIFPNLYRDSVSLMQLSARISACAGITRAAAVMASRANLGLLVQAGLSSGKLEPRPSDLLLAIEGGDERSIAGALDEASSELLGAGAPDAPDSPLSAMSPASLAMGIEDMPDANLALISTPGEYAAMEAMKALRLGLNVMLFSSNVEVEDEIALKRLARERGLFVMGPDCGTAIVNGVPLGFANVVRRGRIGVVAASGSGLQEVTCLIDRAGSGVSQAIGTGGRDLSERVGGIGMLGALAALAADPATRIIVLLSKPPSPRVSATIRDAAEQAGKPVVINFLGADPAQIRGHNILAVQTLEDAAQAAVALAGGEPASEAAHQPGDGPSELAEQQAVLLAPHQKYIRALYSGGTLCHEALVLLRRSIGPVWSNTPIEDAYALPDVWTSREHTALDLGDDLFTRGRPHPIIDQRLRNERIMAEAADRETAVILLDVVLGYGAHADPATGIAGAIEQARGRGPNRHVAFVASICGTQGDRQDLARQAGILRKAGVRLAPSNAAAARLAAQVATRQTPAQLDGSGRP
jgi:succinyl-CoA synthetase alpha subunit